MNPFLDVTGRRQDENKRTQLNRKPQRISPLSTDVSANDNSFSEVDPRPSSTTIESLSRVKVSLRIRPLLNHEKRNGFMDETSNLLTTMTNPAGVQLRNPRNPLEQIHFK